MTSDQIRQKYLDFFRGSPRNHALIYPAPLVLKDDLTTLFTSSGMQPLVPYLIGEVHPQGKRLVDSQPCLRVQDIDEVGDNRHTTFFEMLGNWSLGDYFKQEQLPWIWQFLTKELDLPAEKLWVSVFEGTREVPRDEESFEIWKKIGVPEERIFFYGPEKNWWSRSGTPEEMPVGEIGGPDSEVFFEFDTVKHDSRFGSKCHPSCECGRFLEIANSVFIQYQKTKTGLEELPQKNVDFGGGLERLVAAVNNDPDIFQIDLFQPFINGLEKNLGIKYGQNEDQDQAIRIISDHLRAGQALILDGVEPSNKLHGYVLRRLIRRSAVKMRHLKGQLTEADFDLGLEEKVTKVVKEEVGRFKQGLEKGLREIERLGEIDAKKAFDLYQTYGFPLEITTELVEEKGQKINLKAFQKEFEKHQALSRTSSAGMFKGGLVDQSEEATRLHTATHLLHASLRKILGDHVQQKGSLVTAERLRFDFTHPRPLTDQEIKKVENLVNQQIKKNLKVGFEEMSLEQARKKGALAFFEKKYADRVKVYRIGDFSLEVCRGPHVQRTGEIGRVKIMKEKTASAGVRRIYARTLLVPGS